MKLNKYNIGMRNAMLVQLLSMKREKKKLEILIKQEKKKMKVGGERHPPQITNEDKN